MKKVAIIISPNYKDYAEKYLDDCVESLRKQDYQGEMKIFITDNESSDGSFALLKKSAPEAEIIRNKGNDGFAKGNNGAMRLAIAQGFDCIILFNMDTVVESNCVSEMVKTAESEKYPPCTPLVKGGNQIGAVQARLMLWPERDKINSLGNATHFLGFGYCVGCGEKWEKLDSRLRSPRWSFGEAGGNDKEKNEDDKKGDLNKNVSSFKFQVSKNIFYPSGAAVLFKKEVLEKVGLFDEEFWMYNEDQDLGWRIWLAGWKSVLAPDAVVYHKYRFAKSIKQYYWMDRNRIIAMIKNYHWLTLLLIFPAFVIMELGLVLFSLKTGWFKEKIKVWKYFSTPAKWRYLYGARKQTQSLRKIKDKDITKMITGKIWYQEIDDVKLRLINPAFNFYWAIIRLFIIW